MQFTNKNSLIYSFSFYMALLFGSVSTAYAGAELSGEEIKALISDKTVTFMAANGDVFRAYFAPDGSLAMDDSGAENKWYVEGGEQCMTGTYVKCGTLEKNSDGSYSRINSGGDTVARLSKFEDGKKF